MNTPSPQQEMREALDFDTTPNNPSLDDAQEKFKSFLENINNKTVMYPIITILLNIIVLLIVLWQKKVSWLIKLFVLFISILLTIYTIITFRTI